MRVMHVRRLVGNKGFLIDPEAGLPPNIAFYNPSATQDLICMRVTEFSPTEDRSDMLICDQRTKRTTKIESPYKQLCATYNIYKGLEDVRIVEYQGRIWFTASCTHASSAMLNELVVGYLNITMDHVEYCQKVFIGSLPVKNIVPFVDGEQLFVLDVLKQKIFGLCQDKDTKEITVAYERPLRMHIQHTYGSLRGSASPLHLHGNLWGCVVHSIIFNNTPIKDIQLTYLHHWMEFDLKRGCVTYLSSPFWCMHWGVEFISGCTLEKTSNDIKVNLYLGVRDKHPAKIETSLHHLRVSKDG
jgi:hypothetical protein